MFGQHVKPYNDQTPHSGIYACNILQKNWLPDHKMTGHDSNHKLDRVGELTISNQKGSGGRCRSFCTSAVAVSASRCSAASFTLTQTAQTASSWCPPVLPSPLRGRPRRRRNRTVEEGEETGIIWQLGLCAKKCQDGKG